MSPSKRVSASAPKATPKAALAAKPKAYSYIRFSTPEQAKGDSLRRQTELAENYARAHGLELDKELSLRDLGVSAFSGANAETGALSQFLEAIRQGFVPSGSYLLIESLDRLSRKVARKALRYLEEIVEAGVIVVTLNDNKQYTLESIDGPDFLFAIIIMIRSNEESATKSKRLKAAWHKKRSDAGTRALTSKVPGWLTLDAQRKPVLVEDRAKVVRRIVREYLKGQGMESIARRLNDDNVPTFGGAPYWRRSIVYKTLGSSALIGRAEFFTESRTTGKRVRTFQSAVDGYFPAVISEDDYNRLQERMKEGKASGRQHKGILRNILSGLARCPVCGGTMTRISKGSTKTSKSGTPFLVCAAAKMGRCKYVGVKLEPIEKLLMGRFEEILANMPAADSTVEASLRDKQAALDALEVRMEELLEVLERAPSASLGKRVQELDARLQEDRAELQQLQSSADNSESRMVLVRIEAAQVAFRARPLNRARINACLRELLECVVVDHGTGYLTFRWRHRGVSSLIYTMPAAE